MKNSLFIFIFSLVLLVGFISCKDNGEYTVDNPSIFYTQNENVYILKPEAIQYLDEAVAGDYLLFDKNAPDDIIPEVGTILQSSISEKTPYGFLGKVKRIERNEKIKIITESVSLEEVYPNLNIDNTFNILENIEGVYDESGNSIEYYIEDNSDSQTRVNMELDWQNKSIAIPIPERAFGDECSISGLIRLSFKGSKIGVVNNNIFESLSFDLTPKLRVNAKVQTVFKGGEKIFKTSPFTIRGRFIVGPGIVIPITIPICLKLSMNGEVSSSIEIQYDKTFHTYLRYNKEGELQKGCEAIESENDETPLAVSELEMKGEIYAGVSLSLIAGVFTDKIGVGIELFPKIGVEADASILSSNPFATNPEIMIAGKLEASAFCMGKIFNKEGNEINADFPEMAFFSRQLSLFPNIGNFYADASSTTKKVGYQSDSYYLLESVGAKTGITIYGADENTEIVSLYPEQTSIDNKGIRYYSTKIETTIAKAAYYAAPCISWLGYKWIGEKQKFSEEIGYTLALKYVDADSDWASFDFTKEDFHYFRGSLAELSKNVIDETGRLMRIYMCGRYDDTKKTFRGPIDSYYLNVFHPKKDYFRRDSVSISWEEGDSGYVVMKKKISNGRGTSAVRIYTRRSR